MSQTTTRAAAQAGAPPAHPALQRARGGQMTLAIATDLARQVCQAIPERDYLLICHERRSAGLEDVIAVAVGTVMEQALGDFAEDAPQGGGLAQNAPALEDFAALATVGAHLALTCGQHALAATYADSALAAAPDAPCASMAATLAVCAALRVRWTPTPPEDVEQVLANLAEHRATTPPA